MRLSSSALSVCTIKKNIQIKFKPNPPPQQPAALQDPSNQIFPAEAVKYAELVKLSRRVKTRWCIGIIIIEKR